MDLAVILALVAIVVAVVAVWRAALALAGVALIAMAAVIPAAEAMNVSSGPASATPTEPTTATEPTATATSTTTSSTTATTTIATTTTATTTTATTGGAPAPPPTTSATGRSAQSVSPASRAQQAEAIADGSGWDWRGAGVVIHVAYHPEACCHWGIYDYRDSSLWIGPSAFADPTRLRYVVLHELGHAWQWHSGHLNALAADMAPWGHRGPDGLEAGADCISAVWGASTKVAHYWSCPPAAAARVARRLAGDWT